MHRSIEKSSLVKSTSPAAAPDSVGVDTIVAISTPAGEGAISLVRMSGPNAIAIADKVFRGKETPSHFASHVQHLGDIVDSAGNLIDQVVMSIHRAPASYTGEDLVEISCHGGTLVTAKVLHACLHTGARAARPGEFTERAFLNGKMDLTQAEAVIDLIRARSDLALRSATEQLEGKLGQKITSIRAAIVELLAHIEASIDFPEEGIEPDEGEKLYSRLDSIRKDIQALLATAEAGRILREGVRVVIYGATNAGKSSLLNRLLGYERVIVSDTHGTTRDTIEETVNVRGIPLRLIDTAGLRTSTSDVEREGIARTERSLKQADYACTSLTVMLHGRRISRKARPTETKLSSLIRAISQNIPIGKISTGCESPARPKKVWNNWKRKSWIASVNKTSDRRMRWRSTCVIVTVCAERSMPATARGTAWMKDARPSVRRWI